MKIIQSFILMKLFFLYIGQARDKKSIKNEITFIITNIYVILENFCYCLIQKTLGELPDFEVMTWQLCNLLRSTLNCLQGTLILLQRYEFYLYIKSTVLFIMSLR